jgi:hypothetical protein
MHIDDNKLNIINEKYDELLDLLNDDDFYKSFAEKSANETLEKIYTKSIYLQEKLKKIGFLPSISEHGIPDDVPKLHLDRIRKIEDAQLAPRRDIPLSPPINKHGVPRLFTTEPQKVPVDIEAPRRDISSLNHRRVLSPIKRNDDTSILGTYSPRPLLDDEDKPPITKFYKKYYEIYSNN